MIMQFLSRTLKSLTVGLNPVVVSSINLQEQCGLIEIPTCFAVPAVCHKAYTIIWSL